MEDIRGKIVSIGAPGSGTEVASLKVLEALGIPLADIKVKRLGFAEQVVALRDKTIHVGAWIVGAPASSIIDIATTHDIRILPFTPEEIEKVRKVDPLYIPSAVLLGIYRGVDTPVPTVGIGNTVAVHKDLPERVAYEIVKVIFENLDYLVKVHIAARDTTLERAILVPIPLHPGAERYYREKGILK